MDMKKILSALCVSVLVLSGCSTNPATGRNQFTGLLPAESEASIGATEHQKIVAEYGLYQDQRLQNYVTSIGQRIVPFTERGDVEYKFFLLDSDTVNAFALPGGFVYVTRGILGLANSEAELAGVIAHEIGHVTARHSAERYSRGVVTALGTSVLGAVLDNASAAKALNTGADLYTRSYSRGQESEADTLGIRYLSRAGYDTFAMARFMQSMQLESQYQSQVSGKQAPPAFLSTHPDTGDRVASTSQIAGTYPANPNAVDNRDEYLRMIRGMAFGESAKEGFTQGQTFFHPAIGFKFTAPRGFNIENKTDAVIATGPNNTVMIFDFDSNKQAFDPQSYLQGAWMKQEPVGPIDQISINGMRGATALYNGTVQGRPMGIRLIAIEWQPNVYARFQIAIPAGAPESFIEDLRASTYSFARMSESEKNNIKSERLEIVTAAGGDSVASLSARQPFGQLNEARFRVLNGLSGNQGVQAGQKYKIVVR